MNIASAMDWYRAMLWTTMEVGAPPILAGLVVGLLLAVFQAATQINDSIKAFIDIEERVNALATDHDT